MIVHACDARQIVEARVARTKRGGRKIGQRARVGEPALGAVEHQRLALGGAIPALAVVAELERTAAFASDEVDDTTDRRRTVKRAACAAHHLDSVEIVAGHVGHVEATGRTAVDVNAIHEDQRLGRGRATNGDVGLRARRSALLDHDTGHLAQDLACGMDLLLLNLMRLDDAHRGADRIERLLHPRRRHHKDHLWQLAMGLGSSCGFFGFSLRVGSDLRGSRRGRLGHGLGVRAARADWPFKEKKKCQDRNNGNRSFHSLPRAMRRPRGFDRLRRSGRLPKRGVASSLSLLPHGRQTA